jgi:hypothetical protein
VGYGTISLWSKRGRSLSKSRLTSSTRLNGPAAQALRKQFGRAYSSLLHPKRIRSFEDSAGKVASLILPTISRSIDDAADTSTWIAFLPRRRAQRRRTCLDAAIPLLTRDRDFHAFAEAASLDILLGLRQVKRLDAGPNDSAPNTPARYWLTHKSPGGSHVSETRDPESERTATPMSYNTRNRELRHLLYGHKPNVYRVIYRIVEKQKHIQVLHIRHGARRPFKAS